MCGISGIFSFNKLNVEESRHYAAKLLLEIMSRGKDATGIAVINTDTNNIRMNKAPITASEFLSNPDYMNIISGEFNIILLHTRAATTGLPSNNMNNHPIYSKDFNNIMIHNGIINNDEELKRQYNLKCDAEVDSEVILSMYNILSACKQRKRLRRAMEKISGSAAIALYDSKRLFLYRHTSPLAIGYMPEKDIFLFSSETENIEDTLSESKVFYGIFKTSVLNENVIIHKLDNNQIIDIDFSSKTIATDTVEMKSWEYGYGHYNSGYWDKNGCFVKNNNKKKALAVKDTPKIVYVKQEDDCDFCDIGLDSVDVYDYGDMTE